MEIKPKNREPRKFYSTGEVLKFFEDSVDFASESDIDQHDLEDIDSSAGDLSDDNSAVDSDEESRFRQKSRMKRRNHRKNTVYATYWSLAVVQ